MRLNQYLASATLLSRRAADTAIAGGRVTVDGKIAALGQTAEPDTQTIALDGVVLHSAPVRTIMLNKPTGYVCSRRQQGNNPTIYELLPTELHDLVSVGRLDKQSSGLLLLTNDGPLAHRLTHPRYGKTKRYRVTVTPAATPQLATRLQAGVELEDGLSTMQAVLEGRVLTLELSEGRNRQIRRTLEALGHTVLTLHRDRFGQAELGDLAAGTYRVVAPEELA